MGGFDRLRKRQGYVDNDTGSVEVEVGDRPEDLSRAANARQEAVRRLVHGDENTPGLIEQGGQAERNFVSVMQAVGKSGNARDIAMLSDVLSELPVERAAELLQMGGNPQSVLDAMSRRADTAVEGDIDPGAASALDQGEQLTAAQKKSLRDKQEYELTRTDKSKPVRQYDSWVFQNAHPIDRNGTYDPRYEKFMRDSWESRAKGAARYEGDGRPMSELPAYAQKDIMFALSPDLGKKIYGFQDDALRRLKIDPSVLQMLSPEQIGILSGVAPDQITPEVLQRLHGSSLNDDVIRGLGMNARNALVGRPNLSDAEWQALAGFEMGGNRQLQGEFDQGRRSLSSAEQKIGALLHAAGTEGAVVNPAQYIAPWRAGFRIVNPLTGLLEGSPNAPSGRFLAGQVATRAKVDRPGIIDELTPLFDRSIRHFAPLAPAEQGFRNARNMSEAQWSQYQMTPGSRGLLTLRKYAGNMPFQFFSDVPVRRAGDAPATLGNIEIDTTPQVEPPADVPMNTEVEAPMPMDSDLGMYSMPPRRMNPSVLSALLA